MKKALLQGTLIFRPRSPKYSETLNHTVCIKSSALVKSALPISSVSNNSTTVGVKRGFWTAPAILPLLARFLRYALAVDFASLSWWSQIDKFCSMAVTWLWTANCLACSGYHRFSLRWHRRLRNTCRAPVFTCLQYLHWKLFDVPTILFNIIGSALSNTVCFS